MVSQLQKDRVKLYPKLCENPGCPSGDKLLNKMQFMRHLSNYQSHNHCYSLKNTKRISLLKLHGQSQNKRKSVSEWPKLCKNPDCYTV